MFRAIDNWMLRTLAIPALIACAQAQAQAPPGDGGPGMMPHHRQHHGMGGQHHGMGGPHQGMGGQHHGAGPYADHERDDEGPGAWRRTLSDEQRAEVQRMRLDLARERAPLTTKLRLARVELALLATQGATPADAIDDKIEEVVSLQRELMKLRFGHITRLRALLRQDQRVTFDMGVLRRARGKHRH